MHDLVEMNPHLRESKFVSGGTALLVHRQIEDEASLSVGAPNDGKLVGAKPMPEGEAWLLRGWRRRAYGTHTMVGALVKAFTSFAQEFPGEHPIVLGELSERQGGKVSPHVSHQSGRDADIGYVLKGRKRPSFIEASRRTFDAMKNWVLIRALIDTGEVQRIFVGAEVRKWLWHAALEEHEPDAVRRYFAHIAAWQGHLDHMHVRFRCPEDARRRCISHSVR